MESYYSTKKHSPQRARRGPSHHGGSGTSEKNVNHALQVSDAEFHLVFIGGKVFWMERKIFWLLFIVLSAAMDFTIPIWWSLALTLPLLIGCWWVAYKSGWFG